MILTLGGVFLFNLLCGLVPCDPKYQTPEILRLPRNQNVLTRNVETRSVIPRVKTLYGWVEGYIMKSSMGKDFFAFEGIPYGESTAGPRRWKPPVPKKPWRFVRSTKKTGPDCTQIDPLKLLRVYGSEDCLFINVYTSALPSSAEGEKLPVIVFIHGGSFILGSGSEYGPSYIMNQKDVVYVNFNYRLGPLGFMSTHDDALPGNYGLKDQALALKWVHENIAFFGGNPKNVSLWGNSAGGVSVNLHMISNTTRHYFSNAFSSSGTALHHWAVQSKERTRELTWKLAKRFGCNFKESRKLMSCMENMDSNAIVASQLQLFDWFPLPPILFSPVIESSGNPDAFLTISPEDAYRFGHVAKIPYVFGMTKDEGKTVMLLLLPFMKTFPMRVMWDQIAPYFLQYSDLLENKNEFTKQVTKFYLKGESTREASLDKFSQMVTDRYLSTGILRGIQAHVSTGAPTYMYYFSFSDGNHNLANLIGYRSPEWGAAHTEDMFYFFNDSSMYNGQRLRDPDHDLSDIMINLMTNFATTGVPSYTSDRNEDVTFWDPITDPSEIKALQFDRNVEMAHIADRQIERMEFWGKSGLPKMSLLYPLNTRPEYRKFKVR